MSSSPSSEHAGLFAILLGLVVLVLVGIGLSLVSDGMLSSSKDAAALNQTIDSEARIHSRLIGQVERRRREARGLPEDHAAAIDALQEYAAAERDEIAGLRHAIATARLDIEGLEEAWAEHRTKVRLQARRAVVGTELDTFELPSGRAYHEVRIHDVDATGILIRHRDGRARIDYADLPRDWREKVMWDASEAADAASAPSVPRSLVRPAHLTAAPSGTAEPPDDAADLARKMSALYETLQSTRRDAAEAHTKSHGREQSVPGSLETWRERAVRLDTQTIRLRATFLRARSRLRELDPGHPALHAYPMP